jgi:hypothetical protein
VGKAEMLLLGGGYWVGQKGCGGLSCSDKSQTYES